MNKEIIIHLSDGTYADITITNRTLIKDNIHNIKVKKKNEERKYQEFLKKEKEEMKVNRLKDIETSIKQLELEKQLLS
jgi:hypothetical protein